MAALSPVRKRFVLHWGEMGTRWGINRTVAQVHALLFLSPQPLTAEEITETLAVARSNVSTSLRELQAWGIVRVVHVLGDRRAHFESLKDVWEMFQIILEERKRREIDPTLALLRDSVRSLERPFPGEAYTRARMVEMLEFFEAVTGAYQELRRLPLGALRGFVKARSKVKSILAGKGAG